MKLTKQLVIGGLTLSCAAILGAGSVNATTAIVDVQSLNFREEPSTSSESIDGLVKGEEIEVLEELDGWYKVKVRGDIGYVASDYVKIKGEESNTEEQEENKEEEQQKQEEETTQEETKQEEQVKEEPKKEENNSTTTKVKSEFKIKEASLEKDAKAYILPLINSSVLKNLSNGTSVTIYDEVSNWYYIQDDEISGWVLKSAFGEVVEQAQTTQEGTTTEETNTSEEATTEEENNNSEDFEVTEIDRKIMYVNSDSIFVRKGPGTDYEDIDMLELNDIVSVEGESGDWYKVDIQGKKGFIAKRLLSDEEQEVNEEQETTSRGAEERNIDNKQEEQVASTSNTTYSSTGEEIAALAQEYLGCPYVYGGSGPDSFDCSGFTMYIYKQFGVNLSHSATAQSKVGEYVDKEDLMPGDLVFFKDYQTMDGIGHCGIYIGDGDFIHASSGTGYCVKVSTLLSGSYNTRYESATRIF